MNAPNVDAGWVVQVWESGQLVATIAFKAGSRPEAVRLVKERNPEYTGSRFSYTAKKK